MITPESMKEFSIKYWSGFGGMWDRVGSVFEDKFGILIFFAYDTLLLSHTISPTNYIGFGFSKSKFSFIDTILYRRNI
jgi:hypothetical protein